MTLRADAKIGMVGSEKGGKFWAVAAALASALFFRPQRCRLKKSTMRLLRRRALTPSACLWRSLGAQRTEVVPAKTMRACASKHQRAAAKSRSHQWQAHHLERIPVM